MQEEHITHAIITEAHRIEEDSLGSHSGDILLNLAGRVASDAHGTATGQVTGQVQRLLKVFENEHSRVELQTRLGLEQRDT